MFNRQYLAQTFVHFADAVIFCLVQMGIFLLSCGMFSLLILITRVYQMMYLNIFFRSSEIVIFGRLLSCQVSIGV